jgi:pimeloyl-ACP methyl ester carboxylesterase
MKKLTVQTAVLVFIILILNSVSVSKEISYPFEVKISGKGEKSIIFIPGFACSGEVWDDTKINYEDSYKCYTLTMAGFAGAEAKPEPTFAGWENSIAAYIKENNINKPVIIGHSMGGMLALAIASDYPDLLSGIVVVDALPCLAALSDPTFKSKENNDCSEMISNIKSATDEDFLSMQKSSIPMMLADTSKQRLVINWSVKSDRNTFAKMYCEISNTDLREKISNIKCPALILLESYFTNFEPAISEQYKNLKTADMRYATKGLHFIMYDDKEWYDTQLKSFLK